MILIFIARFLLASLFIVSALKSLFFDFGSFVNYINTLNLPNSKLIAILVLVFKLVSGLILALSPFEALRRVSALGLVIFTMIATVLFHNAFKDKDQFINMMRNISIIGGLLLV